METSPEILNQTPLFRDLSGADQELVARLAQHITVPQGAGVMRIGAHDDTVYVILSGTVKIKVDRHDGVEVVIAILGPGEVLGEISAIDHAGRSADVVAIEDTDLLWLTHADFQHLLASIPAVATNLLQVMARRVRLSTEQIQALCALDALGKVARQILVFADQYGVASAAGVLIPIRLTQSDLGAMIGASRERVNQVMGTLRTQGMIGVDARYRVTVKDMDKLRKLVQNR